MRKAAEQFGGDFSNEINFQEYDKHLEITNCLDLYDLISNFLSVILSKKIF